MKLMEEIGQLIKGKESTWAREYKSEIIKKPESVKKFALQLPSKKYVSAKKMGVHRFVISCLTVNNVTEALNCIYNGQLILWEMKSHYKQFEFKTENAEFNKSIVSQINPQTIYMPENGRVVAMDICHNRTLMHSEDIEEGIQCMAVSPTNKTLAVALESGDIKLIHVDTFVTFRDERITTKKIQSVQFYTENYLMVVDETGSLFFYDIDFKLKHELDERFNQLTCVCLNEESEIMFTAANDLILKKWNLKTLKTRLPPSEMLSYPVELPVHAMCFDDNKKLLFFSQREIVKTFDIINEEILAEIVPPSLIDVGPQQPTGSRMYSLSNMRFSTNMDEPFYETVATSTRQEFAVLALFHLENHNVVVIVRKNGTICCWDEATNSVLLDYYSNEAFEKAVKPRLGNSFLCFNDQGSVECLDIFRLNFFDCCYMQTFSENMSEADFSKKISSFYELSADSPFIRKILHPIYMAFLLNKFHTFKEILADWGYPALNTFQISPLILSLEGKHVNFAEQLFKELTKYKEPITFMYSEIKTMLEFDYKFVKKLLVKCCEKVEKFTNTDERIRKFNHLKANEAKFSSPTGHFTKKNFSELIVEYNKDDEENSFDENDEAFFPNEEDAENEEKESFLDIEKAKQKQKAEIQKNNKSTHMYTDIYRINGFYNFKSGSEDALNFLYQYSESNVEEFVLSDWKRIINYKWDVCRKYFRALCVFYWSYMLFFILFIFNTHNSYFFYTASVLLAIMLTYEIIPLLTYHEYYMHDASNLLDLTMYLLAVAVLTWLYVEPDNDTPLLQTLQVFSLGIGFYKGISFLRIFDLMRSMTHIIYSLFNNSFDVIFLIIYLTLGLTVMMNITMNDQTLYSQFVWVLYMIFCSFPVDETWTYLHFGVVVMLIFLLSLLMVNFTVAKMASKYSELETKQKATNFKEMAKVLFEFEIWFRILRDKKEGQKYLTYFTIKTQEPSFDLTEEEEKEPGQIDFVEIKESFSGIMAQLQKVESRFDFVDSIRKDLVKLSVNAKMNDSNFEIKEIKAKLESLGTQNI